MSFEIENGCLAGVDIRPSPHQDGRPEGGDIDLIVLHGISLPPGEFGGQGIDQLFMGELDTEAHPYYAEIEGLKVSTHLLIRRDGAVCQYVPFDRRAWHAGESEWCGRQRCNDFSVGIELEGTDDLAYTDLQYRNLANCVASLISHYPALSTETIAGHCDIAPGRKTDPGPAFDWSRFREELDAAIHHYQES